MVFVKRKYTSSNGNLAPEHLSSESMKFLMKYVQLDTKHISKTILTHSHDKKRNGQHFPSKFFISPCNQIPNIITINYHHIYS